MKKTLNVNLNGSVFTIDEDAYNLLDNYLNSLRVCFRKEEGASEIITDFEARIAELFSERVRLGHQVITLEHVEEVIARVGKPTDFEDREEKEETQEKQAVTVEPEKGKKKFFRNMDDRLIGGVCSGIASYFGWSVVTTRIIVIALFLLPSIIGPIFLEPFHLSRHSLPPFLLISNFPAWIFFGYIILWFIVPGARTVEQKLLMRGKPVTVENIGKTVAAESTPVASHESKGCLAGFVDLFVSFIKVFAAGIGCLVGLPLIFALFIVIVVLFAVLFGVGGGLLGLGGGLAGVFPSFLVVNHPVLATVTGILLVGIPLFAIIYSIITHFSKAKPLNPAVRWAILLTWIIAFILFFFSGFRIDRNVWYNDRKWWSDAIVGNNIWIKQTYDLDATFDYLDIGDNLLANIHLVQIPDEAQPSIEISGDENLVELVRHHLYGGRLSLSAYQKFSSKTNLTIKLLTNDLKSIQTGFVGNIHVDGAFTGEAMEILLKGVGNFYADSMYVNTLTVRTEGVGSVSLAGRAGKTSLTTSGAGSIKAIELQSDTVYARVNGVGSIQCNPVDFLEGRVHGIGSITYKEEPRNKDVGSYGIGKIKRR